ncbi:MAG: cation:proton antiporter [Woeseiaceae bacterium]|nr:cation:proton antiporter [Woeseiaceae bacterium]
MTDILLLAFLFLVAGVIAVPIASRLGLGSVLGYLLAGIALSPILTQLEVDVVAIQHFAEFGVVMMLFLVGLELEPKLLWEMRARLLGLGGLQVTVTMALIMAVAMLFGQPWSYALAIGMIFALSSTAIVLQTLTEKGLMKSDGGRASFQVLLFEDIAVIPMLAFLPLLAVPELADIAQYFNSVDPSSEAAGGDDGGMSLVEGLPGWQRAIVTVGAIAFVVVVGSVLTRPLFRFIAIARLRELFVAVALLGVVGIALLMMLVGLSPALGTFLAGVVLANSEYRHELESNVDPFKGLLLGLFFITVGAAINFNLLFNNLGQIVGLTLGMMAIKAGVVYVLSLIFSIRGADRWLFTLGLAQAGEFGFVLLSFTVANGVLPEPLADRLLLVVALSMLLTPALFIVFDKLVAPRFATAQTRDADEIDEKGSVIIAGHGRFGGVVNRILSSAGFKTVVLDYQSEQLERLRAFGIKVFFGDATRPDMLHAAGIDEASMLVITIDDKDQATELVHYVHSNHPHVYIVVRAIDRHHVYDLWAAGARDIIRENFDSSVRAGRSALEALGMHPFDAELQTRAFVAHDQKQMRDMADVYDPDIPAHENEEYVQRTKAFIDSYADVMRGNSQAFGARIDRAWSPPTLADVVAEEKEDAECRQEDAAAADRSATGFDESPETA